MSTAGNGRRSAPETKRRWVRTGFRRHPPRRPLSLGRRPVGDSTKPITELGRVRRTVRPESLQCLPLRLAFEVEGQSERHRRVSVLFEGDDGRRVFVRGAGRRGRGRDRSDDDDERSDGVVTWQGREDFADRRPQVVLAPAGAGGTDGTPWPVLVGGGILGAVALSALGFRWYRGRTPRPVATESDADSPADGVDEAVLADEDHVRRLLTEHDGRMRQNSSAEELNWSRSKTSRVLGRMAEDGRIEKLQLGRENVIALPEDSEQ
ncbi:MAG: helix-turn-helix transcriptional regulator [Haloplanus sp.]